MGKILSRLSVTFICGLFFTMIVSGCATLTKGGSQSVTVDTNPSGATCTLSKQGKTLAIINPTPGTVNIEKGKDTISVICKKDGYHDGAGTLSAEFQGMTFGNILFGGLIGLAIDAGSGAIHKYQPMLSLLLIPKEFSSTSERDVFFENMKAEYLSEHSKTISNISETCDARDDAKKDFCLSQIKATEAAKEARLAEIDKMHNLAKVRNEK